MGKSISKKDKEFWDMVNQCVQNSKNRKNNPIENKAWQQRYYASVRPTLPPLPLKVNEIKPCYAKNIDDSKWKRQQNEELAAREKIAQEEIDRKRTQIAPAYNKGGYMFITNPENVKKIYKGME